MESLYIGYLVVKLIVVCVAAFIAGFMGLLR
jgi:hypothetical protein